MPLSASLSDPSLQWLYQIRQHAALGWWALGLSIILSVGGAFGNAPAPRRHAGRLFCSINPVCLGIAASRGALDHDDRQETCWERFCC